MDPKLTASAATHTEPPSRAAPRVLVTWDGGVAGAELPTNGSVVLGRAEGCDVRVDHGSVSRQHAALHVSTVGDDVEIRVEDLGSSNGTRKNGVRLPARIPVTVSSGDVLEVGGTTVVLAGVRASGPAPSTSALPEGPARGSATPARRAPPVVREPSMVALYELVRDVARGKLAVLVLGETGSGKEIVAEAVHLASPRANGPFVRLNTTAVPETLFESTLFGHERGAFTGAAQPRAGLLEAADGGTLFLDEIGDLPLLVQAKLLRVLESGEVSRVGAARARHVDVRFVAATNRDLDALVRSGAFRQDLYYRLNGVALHVPPLRERPSEIEPLARAFAEEIAASLGLAAPAFTPGALERLAAHRWPGNVRELRQAVERAVLVSRGGLLDAPHLGPGVHGAAAPPPPLAAGAEAAATLPPPALAPDPATAVPAAASPAASGASDDLRARVDAFERERILEALTAAGGNQTEAARLLGIARRTLVNRIEAYGLPRPRKGAPKP